MRPKFDTFQIMRQLQGARQQIAKSLGLRDEARIEQAGDEMDRVQAAEARDLAVRNLDRSVRLLRQIEEALRRLDKGEYGICANCEEEIGAKRLRALPWAQFCLTCQEIADQSKGADSGRNAPGRLLDAA
jgi:DnaK suppressor protein